MIASSRLPRISVIVTSFNYANYLRAALDSVLSQTRPPHELIVVDDGSTDASRSILESYSDRVKVILGPNKGQAASFEIGFRASSGDVIIFLDADDALKPEALETLQRAWHPSYSAICYGMELIDRHGMPCGLYPERVDDFDRRALLVESGSFPFMPTSGNAFARRTVGRACPFPAERWRLGADGYIIRVAALEGRMLPLKQVLACYRVHPGNNYFRVGASQIWLDRRGNLDIADLAGFFADWPALGDTAKQSAERVRLANASVRTHLTLDQGRRRPGPALRRLARHLAGARGTPLLARLSAATVALALSTGLWRLTDTEDWLRYPHHRPRWLRRLLDGLGFHRLRQSLASGKEPRWRAPTPLGRHLDPARETAGVECLGVGWTTPRLAGRAVCTGRAATLNLVVAPTPAAISVELSIACSIPEGIVQGDVEVSVGGLVLARRHVETEATITVQLPAGTARTGSDLVLDLRFGAANAKQRGLRLGPVRGLPPTMELRALRVGLESAMDPAGLIEGVAQPFRGFLRAAAAEWETLANGGAALVGTAGEAVLVSTTATDAMIELRTADDQPRGLMRISLGATELFVGRWDKIGGRLWLRLPASAGLDERSTHVVHHLTFAFAPDDPIEIEHPSLDSVVFHPAREAALLHRVEHSRAPPINPGQLVTFAATDLGRGALGASWMTGEDAPGLSRGDGTIRLYAPPGLRDLTLHLSVEPPFAIPPGYTQLVTVLKDDEVLARVNLQGEADIAVPVGTPHGELVLRILSLSVATDEFGTLVDPDAALSPAPLRLRSLSVDGTWDADGGPLLPIRYPGYVETLVEQDSDGDTVAAAFSAADERSLISAIASAPSLRALANLGRKGAGAPTVPRPAARIDQIRAIVSAIAQGPAYALPWIADLAALPEPLLWFPSETAAWLTADPPALSVADAPSYESYLVALLKSVGDTIGSEPPGSARHTLAIAVFGMLRPQQLLFRAGTLRDYMSGLAAVGERLLTVDGFQLPCLFPARSVGRLRVGVIVRNWRNNPERRIAEATINGLDARQFDPVLILLSELEGDEPAAAISLAGLPVAQSVHRIRTLGLDVVMLGSFFLRFDTLAAIVAHKLAPLQLVTAAVSPVTSGLSSFDAILSSDLIDPSGAEEHYAERLVRVSGPIQAFAPTSEDKALPGERNAVREEFGLPTDGPLLVSGAMMQKVGSDLLEAWAMILAAVPSARLILYPFALNWSVDFAASAFRNTAAAALVSRGVAPDRLIILDPLEASDVRRLLRSADLYLDSFPYAGAATVTEALEEGLPVVSMLGDNQRGRQGAGWLKAFGLEDDVAETVDSYVARAVALATNDDLRLSRKAIIAGRLAAGPPHLDLATFGRELGAVLIAEAARKGITVQPPS